MQKQAKLNTKRVHEEIHMAYHMGGEKLPLGGR
jgi:hypothetical protein